MKLFESFSEFLNETYTSVKELEFLSKDVIDEFINHLKDYMEFQIISGSDTNVDKIDRKFDLEWFVNRKSRNYKEIKDFINQDLKIFFVPEKEWNHKGLANYNNLKVNNTTNKKIELKLDYKKMVEVVNKIENGLDIKKDPLFIGRDGLQAVLLHELQHAFDDFRSEGKYRGNDELDIYGFPIKKNYKQYLNLKHEIDARFAQTFSTINFYDKNKIRDFDDVLNDFKNEFVGFNILSSKDKKRILSLFGKFYILKKEELNEI